jgi:hypothetical protein
MVAVSTSRVVVMLEPTMLRCAPGEIHSRSKSVCGRWSPYDQVRAAHVILRAYGFNQSK